MGSGHSAGAAGTPARAPLLYYYTPTATPTTTSVFVHPSTALTHNPHRRKLVYTSPAPCTIAQFPGGRAILTCTGSGQCTLCYRRLVPPVRHVYPAGGQVKHYWYPIDNNFDVSGGSTVVRHFFPHGVETQCDGIWLWYPTQPSGGSVPVPQLRRPAQLIGGSKPAAQFLQPPQLRISGGSVPSYQFRQPTRVSGGSMPAYQFWQPTQLIGGSVHTYPIRQLTQPSGGNTPAPEFPPPTYSSGGSMPDPGLRWLTHSSGSRVPVRFIQFTQPSGVPVDADPYSDLLPVIGGTVLATATVIHLLNNFGALAVLGATIAAIVFIFTWFKYNEPILRAVSAGLRSDMTFNVLYKIIEISVIVAFVALYHVALFLLILCYWQYYP